MLVAQSCLTGCSVHGILQARVLQWGLFLTWDEGRGLSRVRLGRGLGGFPLGGAVCKGHAQCSAFVPYPLLLLWALQRWQLGFLTSLYLLSRICPNYACLNLIIVPYSFLVFCCLRIGMSRCNHHSTEAKGPRFHPVSLLGNYTHI